jgi:hypothetical protein
MREFDACIDLSVHNTAGADADSAVARVRREVGAIPGANWISVEWCGSVPAGMRWLHLFRRGDGRDRTDEAEFYETRSRIDAIVRAGMA